MPYLPWSLPLSALSHIAHVRITCHGVPLPGPTADFASWKSIWETLRVFRGLRDLAVEVVPATGGYDKVRLEQFAESEDEVLAPVRRMAELVRGCEKGRCVLRVPWGLSAELGWGVVGELRRDGWRVLRSG